MAGPGWYNDETDPTLARWHDGVEWTDHVVLKAEWEAKGHPPPPPEELFGTPASAAAAWSPPEWAPPAYEPAAEYEPPAYRYEDDEEYEGAALVGGGGDLRATRARVLVGSLAIVGAIVAAGIALADDDGDPAPEEQPSTSTTLRRSAGLAGELGGVGDLELDADPASADGTEDRGASGGGGTTARTSGGTSATSRGSSGGSSGGVQRTESSTRSRTNTGPVTFESNSRDQVDIGNQTQITRRDEYIPPSSTAPPSTTATTASPGTTAPTDATPPTQP